ncbi:universal stress protein YxiE-like [Crassostrea virginica]
MKKFLIALDGSKESEFAFRQYVEKIHKDDNHVTAVYCAHYSLTDPEALLISKEDAKAIEKILEEDEKKILTIFDNMKSLLSEYKVSGEVVRLEGRPETAILAKAEEIQATMIVMGSRGLGTIRRTILGSVSEYILHHSHIPVMICK